MRNGKDIVGHLVKSARKGDKNSMRELYDLHIDAMYSIAYRIVADRYDAEDIVQESFISAFTNISTIRESNTFSGWLKRIVINRSVSLVKKRRDYRDITEVDFYEEDDDSNIEYAYNSESINNAILQLPPKARVVLNLYLLEDYKHKEIAQILNISESTSKSQYLRALKLLKEHLCETEN